jgi:uncharacterized membrane protein
MKCACVLALLCLLSGLLSGQVELSPPLLSPPDQSVSSWQTLDSLLTSLSDEALNLSIDSETLRTSLGEARQQLTELSSKLEESRTEASALSSSLALSESSLATLSASLRAREIELWLWRGGTMLGAVLTVLALIRP